LLQPVGIPNGHTIVPRVALPVSVFSGLAALAGVRLRACTPCWQLYGTEIRSALWAHEAQE